MQVVPSSISNSEAGIARPPRGGAFYALRFLCCMLAWLMVIEIAVACVLAPSTPWASKVAGLVRYSEYGRSIEGKLAQRLTTVDAPAPNDVVRAGWLDPNDWSDKPAHRLPEHPLIAVYGQSFAFRAVRDAADRTPQLAWRLIGGPAAPFNHSVGAMLLDLPSIEPDVVVIGVLASSLLHINSMAMLRASFESPAPYTFPIWDPRTRGLTVPAISSYPAFAQAFVQRGTAWQSYRSLAQSTDSGLDDFTLDETALDRSFMVRLIRRGWVTHQSQPVGEARDVVAARDAAAHGLLNLAVQAAQARNIPLVLMLFNDAGQTGVLDQLLFEKARSLGVTVISSTSFFSSLDPSNFVSDGHFTPANDALMGQALAEALKGLIRH